MNLGGGNDLNLLLMNNKVLVETHTVHKVILGSRSSGLKERLKDKMTSKSIENDVQTLQKHFGFVIKLVTSWG